MAKSRKKIGFGPLIIAIVIIIVFIVLQFKQIGQPAAEIKTEKLNNKELSNKLNEKSITNIQNLVKNYLDNNINNLASNSKILNNVFSVTKITWLDNNRILINYKDKQNIYTARASYVINQDQPLKIINFQLLSKNNKLINSNSNGLSNDDLTIVSLKQQYAKNYHKDFSVIDLSVSNQEEKYLRGLIKINGDKKNSKMFLATIVNNEWQIVFDNNNDLDCNKLKIYNFPASILPECAQ